MPQRHEPAAPRLSRRYARFSARVLASLSEIERRDVRAFDHWFYRTSGWRWLVAHRRGDDARRVARVAAAVEHVVRSRRRSCSTSSCCTLLWTGLTAWFGYRKFHGRMLRFIAGRDGQRHLSARSAASGIAG